MLGFPAQSGEAHCSQDYAMNVWYREPDCQGASHEQKMVWGDCMTMLVEESGQQEYFMIQGTVRPLIWSLLSALAVVVSFVF